jgi:hypothetical protein
MAHRSTHLLALERVGSFMAPKTRLGICLRNRMLQLAYLLPGKGMMGRIAMQRANGITFGDYPIQPASMAL